MLIARATSHANRKYVNILEHEKHVIYISDKGKKKKEKERKVNESILSCKWNEYM